MFVDEASAGRDIKLLRDITVGFLIAGRDSTAQTLSWVFYCVARHPRMEQQLVKELRSLWPTLGAGHATEPFLPTADQLQRLVFLEATIRETMCLYPIVAFNTRNYVSGTLMADDTVVTAGTRVGLPMFAMGRMPSIWGQDADDFKPERWLERVNDATRIKNVSAFRFPAFHDGLRECLGRHLAMLEMKTVVAALLSSFRLIVWPDGYHARYVASLVHPMEEPLQVRVAPRFHEGERQQ